MRILSVGSIGTVEALSLHGPVRRSAYPPSPNGEWLRAERVRRELGLRACAALLGIPPVELSGIERGSMVPDNWGELFEKLGWGTP